MRVDDRLADAQPDPHALLFRRKERFEQPRQLLFAKAGALIGDAYGHSSHGVWQSTNHYFAFSHRAVDHGIQGVQDQIQQDLLRDLLTLRVISALSLRHSGQH